MLFECVDSSNVHDTWVKKQNIFFGPCWTGIEFCEFGVFIDFIVDKNDFSKVSEHEKEKEECAIKGVFEVDEATLKMLLDMGVSENHATKALIGTKNGNVELAFQYIDAHQNDPAFNAEADPRAVEAAAKKKKKKPRYIPLELQRLFTQLKLVDRLAVSTHGSNCLLISFQNHQLNLSTELTTKGFQWQGMDGQVQHDAHELNR